HIIDKTLKPMLVRADKNIAEDAGPLSNKAVTRVAKYFRTNISRAIFTGHLRNAVEMVGNFFPLLLKNNSKDLYRASIQMVKDRKSVKEQVYSKSTYMRTRTHEEFFMQQN